MLKITALGVGKDFQNRESTKIKKKKKKTHKMDFIKMGLRFKRLP